MPDSIRQRQAKIVSSVAAKSLIVGAVLSGRFDGCSFPTFVHFGATDCKEGLCGNTFMPKYLCGTLRLNATHCKVAKNRLKIRRG